MKVRYTKIPDLLNPGQHGWYPLIQACARNNNKSVLIRALVDSGAVGCVFPAFVAGMLGIAIKSGEAQTYFGLSGRSSIIFRHTINLKITGLEKWNQVEVGFTEDDLLPPILGQNGFFSNYQIIFERYRYQIEINTHENARTRRRKGY
jgi:hypothetical protein